MISELNDNEILDFLMTSNFEDDYSPAELKYLLNKWKYFYRVLHANKGRDEDFLEGKIKNLEEIIDGNNTKIKHLISEISENEIKIGGYKNRKLTWKERFTGKIIDKENEN
jgi:hypothetical protein